MFRVKDDGGLVACLTMSSKTLLRLRDSGGRLRKDRRLCEDRRLHERMRLHARDRMTVLGGLWQISVFWITIWSVIGVADANWM